MLFYNQEKKLDYIQGDLPSIEESTQKWEEQDRLFNHAFGHIKQSVFRNKSLSANAKALYGYLASFVNNENHSCFVSKSTTMEEMGWSEKTYYKYLNELLKAGVVSTQRRMNQSTIITITNHEVASKEERQQNKMEQGNLSTEKESAENVDKLGNRKVYCFANGKLYRTNKRTINKRNSITKESIESNKSTSSSQNDLELYLSSNGNELIRPAMKKLIAKYALNKQNEFDLELALSIEKAIFGAKKSATNELLDESVLDENDLVKGFFEVNSETMGLEGILNRIFYILRKDRDAKQIKNQKLYLFSALKKEFKEHIACLKEILATPVPLFEF